MKEESNWENGGDRGMEENMERDCEGLDGAFYRWEIEFLDVDFKQINLRNLEGIAE